METPVFIRAVNHYFPEISVFALVCAFDITLCLICAISQAAAVKQMILLVHFL